MEPAHFSRRLKLLFLIRLVPLCEPHTRIVVCGYTWLWRRLLAFAQGDVHGLLQTAGFRVVRTHRLILMPMRIPFVSELVNRIAACLPLVSKLCMVSVVVARPLCLCFVAAHLLLQHVEVHRFEILLITPRRRH